MKDRIIVIVTWIVAIALFAIAMAVRQDRRATVPTIPKFRLTSSECGVVLSRQVTNANTRPKP